MTAAYAYDNGIGRAVIGDLKGLRNDLDVGRLNKQVHSLPFDQIYTLLE